MNSDSATPAQGEFRSKVAPSEPLTTKGVCLSILKLYHTSNILQHKPGVLVGNDAVPEFKAETLLPGTAPADRSFKPNIENEVPAQATGAPSAQDTITGATSADVHTGLGHPGQGQTSSLQGQRRNVSSGLIGVGANASDPISAQGKDKDHTTGNKADQGRPEDILSAAEKMPVGAEQVASERS